MPAVCSEILRKLEEFVAKDRRLGKGPDRVVAGGVSSLLSGSLSLALCCILDGFRLCKSRLFYEFCDLGNFVGA